VRFEAGRWRGRLAVEPNLADFEKSAEIRAVSNDGLLKDIVQRHAIEMVFAPPGRVVCGTEQNQFCHVTNRSIVRCR